MSTYLDTANLLHVFIVPSSEPPFRWDAVAISVYKYIELQDSAGWNQYNAQKDYSANESIDYSN